MANVFQAASGYRDPLKAMTLKALEARAKAAADASATAMQPTQVANPLQGAAGVLDVLGSRMNEGRINAAEASGRQDLASAMAGINMDTGPDAGTIARIATHDPELAQHLYDQAMERKNKQDEMKFQAGEHGLDREQRAALQKEAEGATASEGALQRTSQQGIAAGGWKSAQDINANTQTNENTRSAASLKATADNQEDQQKATSDLATQNADAAAKLERQKAATTMAQGTEETSKIEAQYNAGGYGPVGSQRAMTLRDEAERAANLKGTPPLTENTYGVGAAGEAVKRHGKIIEDAQASSKFTGNIRTLIDLGKQVETGPEAGMKLALGPMAQALGIPIDNLDKVQAYAAIADKLAPNMRVQGAGSSSDFDAKQFLSSLPSVSKLPGANDIIEATLLANDQVNQEAAKIAMRARSTGPDHIDWQKADEMIAALPNPFENYNKFLKEVQSGRATPPPGGGGEDPNDPLGYRSRK